MKTMKKMLCLLLACALLLTFGCKKDEPVETPDVPETPGTPTETPVTPPVEQPKEEEPKPPVINTWPDTTPKTVVSEYEDMTSEQQDMELALHNSYAEVGYFVEWQLGDGYHIYQTLPGDKDGEYLMWGMQILKPGLRGPFLLRVKVTPDGKDFSLLSKEFLDVTEEWKAVQNYRALVTDLAGGYSALERLGYQVTAPSGKNAFWTNASYGDFQVAMLSIMTQEMYDAHWADFFSDQEGMLHMHDTAGSGFFYAVEMVQPQEDGTYLSYEHYFDFLYNRQDFFVKVDLVEMPNGTFRVNGWDPDNTAIMEQAAIAMPIQ